MYRYLAHPIEDIIWNYKGKTKVKCGGFQSEFDSTFGSQFRKVKRRLHSEYVILEDIIQEVTKNDVYYDIGAGLGLHTCLPAKKITQGKVISVEPYGPNIEQLKKNVNLNQLRNIEILKVAMFDSKGTVKFNEEYNSLSSNNDGVSVNTVAGDSLVARGEIPQPNVVKIDVEGSEPQVVEGLKESLKRKECRALYCEVHLPSTHRPSINNFGMNVDTFKKKLESYGFNLVILKRRRREIFIKATK